MTGIRPVTRGAAVLGIARPGRRRLGDRRAGGGRAAAAARAAFVHPPAHQATEPASGAARAVGRSWPSRTVLRESVRVRSATQVLSLARGADFALVPVNRPETVFQLRADQPGQRGGPERAARFGVSGLRLASGFLWVYGQVYSGPHGTRVRLVLHQCQPVVAAPDPVLDAAAHPAAGVVLRRVSGPGTRAGRVGRVPADAAAGQRDQRGDAAAAGAGARRVLHHRRGDGIRGGSASVRGGGTAPGRRRGVRVRGPQRAPAGVGDEPAGGVSRWPGRT